MHEVQLITRPQLYPVYMTKRSIGWNMPGERVIGLTGTGVKAAVGRETVWDRACRQPSERNGKERPAAGFEEGMLGRIVEYFLMTRAATERPAFHDCHSFAAYAVKASARIGDHVRPRDAGIGLPGPDGLRPGEAYAVKGPSGNLWHSMLGFTPTETLSILGQMQSLAVVNAPEIAKAYGGSQGMIIRSDFDPDTVDSYPCHD